MAFMNTLVPTEATFRIRARIARLPCRASAIPRQAKTRVRLAIPARRLPALAHRLRLLRRLARQRHLQQLHDRLRDQTLPARRRRDPRPTTAIIDSQSVQVADTVPKARQARTTPRRSTAARHVAAGAIGLVLAVVITAASAQDRDAPGRCQRRYLHFPLMRSRRL